MNSICKDDYKKLKKQFDIKMHTGEFPLAIVSWILIIIAIGFFLVLSSTANGYMINSKIIPIFLYILLMDFVGYKSIRDDLEFFTDLGYKRKRYFINKKIMEFILFSIITFFMSIWLVTMRNDISVRYLGFLFQGGFISFLKYIIVNYLFINLIRISYLFIGLVINTTITFLFKLKGKRILQTFVLFILPLLIPSVDLHLSDYNMRVLTYVSPIIILIEIYFEYKIIRNMDV
ncbi:hypothetical protein BN906_01819 [Clostridium tetani 12124569]|nr:hypothetical protein BN906_01819 [Clostridium tetani 12124569]